MTDNNNNDDQPSRVDLLIASLDAAGHQVRDVSPESFASAQRRRRSESQKAGQTARSNASGFRASLRSAMALVQPSTISRRASNSLNKKRTSLSNKVSSRLSLGSSSRDGSVAVSTSRRRSSANPLFDSDNDKDVAGDLECEKEEEKEEDTATKRATALGLRWKVAEAVLADNYDDVAKYTWELTQFNLADVRQERHVEDESPSVTKAETKTVTRSPYTGFFGTRDRNAFTTRKEKWKAYINDIDNNNNNNNNNKDGKDKSATRMKDSNALSVMHPNTYVVDQHLAKYLPKHHWRIWDVSVFK
jgi:hypothetical protein